MKSITTVAAVQEAIENGAAAARQDAAGREQLKQNSLAEENANDYTVFSDYDLEEPTRRGNGLGHERGSGGSEKVWNDITPTQPNYPGTELPRSFVLKTDGETLWVHGNATEHMAEYLSKQASAGHSQENTKLSAQIMLYDMQQSLRAVTKSGVSYGGILHHGNWDFIIKKSRNGESYDAVIHALIKK